MSAHPRVALTRCRPTVVDGRLPLYEARLEGRAEGGERWLLRTIDRYRELGIDVSCPEATARRRVPVGAPRTPLV
jgi:hypothetical protein